MSESNKVFKQAGRKNGEECISNNSNVCLGGNTKILDSSNATHGGSVAGNSDKLNGTMNEDLQVGARKGKIGAFYGFSKNELEYRPVLDIDTMAPIMSTAIGVGTVMEVVGKELTLEAFGRFQNNNERLVIQSQFQGRRTTCKI
ncbi:hypothetical protein AGMMS49921_04310 [Endomicrobiia bacterium]|nr:hypothetical protein AGMMS49921_04310 [Endomicrobiia bacterium]